MICAPSEDSYQPGHAPNLISLRYALLGKPRFQGSLTQTVKTDQTGQTGFVMLQLKWCMNYFTLSLRIALIINILMPGAAAWSEVCPLGMQAALSSIPMSGTFFHGDLVMKKISMAILHLLLIQEEQLSVTGERIALSTAKMPGRLAQEQLVRVTDRARNDLKCVGKEIKQKKPQHFNKEQKM